RRPGDAGAARRPPPRGGDRLHPPRRRPPARAGGDDAGGDARAATGGDRRLRRQRRGARQGRRLCRAGDRRGVRHRAARVVDQCHRPAALRGAGRPAGAGRAPALPGSGLRRDAGMTRAQAIAAGLLQVRARIAAAERAAGRAPGSVKLLAVSKKMPPDDVRAALAAEPEPPEWHYIGPLQSNKVKYVAGQVALIHTVDSAALLEAIAARGAPQACLVQVNVAGEAQKRGVAPADLPALLDRFATLPNVTCAGLMLIPPLTENPDDARPHFTGLRALRDREAARARPNVDLRELSMGMSGDLEGAVAEGATIVRVGTAIFGARPLASPQN